MGGDGQPWGIGCGEGAMEEGVGTSSSCTAFVSRRQDYDAHFQQEGTSYVEGYFFLNSPFSHTLKQLNLLLTEPSF